MSGFSFRRGLFSSAIAKGTQMSREWLHWGRDAYMVQILNTEEISRMGCSFLEKIHGHPVASISRVAKMECFRNAILLRIAVPSSF